MKYLLSILAVAAIVLAMPLSAGEKDNPKTPKVEMRIYDVRDLLEKVQQFPAPDLSIRHTPAIGVNANIFTTEPQNPLTMGSISDFIRNRVAPESWDPALGSSIQEYNGQLIVMQQPELQKVIMQLLNALRSYSKMQVSIRARLVPTATVPRDTFFTDADAQKLGNGLFSPRIICFNGQTTHITSGQHFNYIHDIDSSENVFSIVTQQAMEKGFVLEVQPTVSSDRKNVELDVSFMFCNEAKVETRAVTFAPPLSGKENAPVKIDIETPSVQTGQLKTQVVVPTGKWALCGVLKNPNKDTKEKHLLLLVHAEPTEKDANTGVIPPAPIQLPQLEPANPPKNKEENF